MQVTTSRRRIQPLLALSAFRKLIKNPEDTHQVFMIGEALRGKSLARVTERFAATPLGVRVFEGGHALMPLLTDRDALARLPAGSLGRAYLDFVVGERLSAEGLVAAAKGRDEITDATPAEQAFRTHIRDNHDLWHVATGYGRDPLGEVCLLAFSYAQTGLNGLGAIALLGTLRIGREAGGARVRTAVMQGYRTGKRAAWLPAIDWQPLLARDLAQVRRDLGLGAPDAYGRIVGARAMVAQAA